MRFRETRKSPLIHLLIYIVIEWINLSAFSSISWAHLLDLNKIEDYLNELYLTRQASDSQAKVEVEDFLDYVKNISPEHFKKYSLVYSSNSLQSATYTHPRVVAYGKNGRFTFTYNDRIAADIQKKGFVYQGSTEVEIIEFNEQFDKQIKDSPKYKFYSIDFRDPKPVLRQEIDRCISCHDKGKGMLPIWWSAGEWPGVYGSVKDHLYAILIDPTNKKSRKERDHYQDYLSSIGPTSRYRYLQLQNFDGTPGPNSTYATLLSALEALR